MAGQVEGQGNRPIPPSTPAFGVVGGRGSGGHGTWDRFVDPTRTVRGGSEISGSKESTVFASGPDAKGPDGEGRVLGSGAVKAKPFSRSNGSDECLPAVFAALGGESCGQQRSGKGVLPPLPTPTAHVWKGKRLAAGCKKGEGSVLKKAGKGGGSGSKTKSGEQHQRGWLNCVIFSSPSG